MEHFAVSLNGMRNIGSLEYKLTEEERFTVSLFSMEEWGTMNKHLALLQETEVSAPTLARLTAMGERSDHWFERLNPSLFFVRYSDFDSNSREADILFFLSPHHITLLSNGWVDMEQMTDWAQRDLMKTPSDLAQLLGMAILDHHQNHLELLEEEMDRIEEDILERPRRWQRNQIFQLHKKILGLKKSLNAHETIFSRLSAMDKYDNGSPAWQDLVAETQQKLENARQTHELIEVLLETYQQAVDNRANDIMKVLTLLATILLPINLVTSFFGMNFEHLPLIHSPYGMPIFYLISVVIISVVLIMFWRKSWLK